MDDIRRVGLDDGRFIDCRVSGPTGGLPLVFHHGTPGAGTPIRTLEHAAHARGLRVVTMTRPGYGDSSRDRGRSVDDVVGDLAAVLESIGADRCLVAGWSGGRPHALACAARLDAAMEDMASQFHEGLRNGIDGWFDDDLAFTRAWGFDLAEIRKPVMLWQGRPT